MKAVVFALVLVLGAQGAARAQAGGGTDERLARILERAGESVERYQKGLFRIAFTEVLRNEELSKDMTPRKAKEFVYDSVVVREQLSEGKDDYLPKTVRRLKTVDGKPAKESAAIEGFMPNVTALGFLLQRSRKLFQFTLDGEESLGGRKAYRIRTQRPGQGEPKAEWEGMSFHVFAPTEFIFWVDAESFDVLQVATHLIAPFEFDSPHVFNAGPLGRFGPTRRLRYAREDTTIRFRRVQFKDPEQVLLVPDSAEWLTVIEGAKHPRLRTTLRCTDYRRFRADVKVIEEPDK
jgi:hypothetical protein